MLFVTEIDGNKNYPLYKVSPDIASTNGHTKVRASNMLLTDVCYKESNLYRAICEERFVVVKLLSKDLIFFVDGDDLYFSWVHHGTIHTIILDEKITKIAFAAEDVKFYYPASNAEETVYHLEDNLGYKFAEVLNGLPKSKQSFKKYGIQSIL